MIGKKPTKDMTRQVTKEEIKTTKKHLKTFQSYWCSKPHRLKQYFCLSNIFLQCNSHCLFNEKGTTFLIGNFAICRKSVLCLNLPSYLPLYNCSKKYLDMYAVIFTT